MLVCSKEKENEGCYDALPNDVTGSDYIAASMPVADQSSGIMIIAHTDGTEVIVDIPDSYSHTIELTGYPTSEAGGSIMFTLNESQVFHLAQTSTTNEMSNVNGYHIKSGAPVSVISGNVNSHAVVQLPPTTKFGKQFVFVYAATYIVQPVQTGKEAFYVKSKHRISVIFGP